MSPETQVFSNQGSSIVWNHPGALTVLGVALAFVVYLVVIELLGRSATHDAAADTTVT